MKFDYMRKALGGTVVSLMISAVFTSVFYIGWVLTRSVFGVLCIFIVLPVFIAFVLDVHHNLKGD